MEAAAEHAEGRVILQVIGLGAETLFASALAGERGGTLGARSQGAQARLTFDSTAMFCTLEPCMRLSNLEDESLLTVRAK